MGTKNRLTRSDKKKVIQGLKQSRRGYYKRGPRPRPSPHIEKATKESPQSCGRLYKNNNNKKLRGGVITEPAVTQMVKLTSNQIVDRTIESYTVAENINTIGSKAFANMANLTTVIIPQTVTLIESRAFENSGITSIIIHDSVTKIQNGAFNSCKKLTEATLSNNITNISMQLFENCDKLEAIVIPDKVTIIDFFAFSGCTKLKSVIIPPNVTKIGQSAFSGCQDLESVIIPTSVEKIEDGAFIDCYSLKKIHIPNYYTDYISKNVFPSDTIINDAIKLDEELSRAIRKFIKPNINMIYDKPIIIRDALKDIPKKSLILYRGQMDNRTINHCLFFSCSLNRNVANTFSLNECCKFIIHVVDVPCMILNEYRLGRHDEYEVLVLGGGTFYKNASLNRENKGVELIDEKKGVYETWYSTNVLSDNCN